MSPTRVPGEGGWCRGGNRYGLGGGDSLNKIQSFKFLQLKFPNSHFMFSSRYWSRIQYEISILSFMDMSSHITKIPFHVLKILIPYYQVAISCFWIDIDPISKIFKNSLDGLQDFRHLSSPKKSTLSVSKILRFSKFIFFKKYLVFPEVFGAILCIQS